MIVWEGSPRPSFFSANLNFYWLTDCQGYTGIREDQDVKRRLLAWYNRMPSLLWRRRPPQKNLASNKLMRRQNETRVHSVVLHRQNFIDWAKSDILTSDTMKITVIWEVTPCGLVDTCPKVVYVSTAYSASESDNRQTFMYWPRRLRQCVSYTDRGST